MYHWKPLMHQHISEILPLKSSGKKMCMKMFDTSVIHGFSGCRKVFPLSKKSFDELVRISHFWSLFWTELVRELYMLKWHKHEVIFLSRVGIDIVDNIPILSFPKNIFFICNSITKRTISLSVGFISLYFMVLFSLSELCHNLSIRY